MSYANMRLRIQTVCLSGMLEMRRYIAIGNINVISFVSYLTKMHYFILRSTASELDVGSSINVIDVRRVMTVCLKQQKIRPAVFVAVDCTYHRFL